MRGRQNREGRTERTGAGSGGPSSLPGHQQTASATALHRWACAGTRRRVAQAVRALRARRKNHGVLLLPMIPCRRGSIAIYVLSEPRPSSPFRGAGRQGSGYSGATGNARARQRVQDDRLRIERTVALRRGQRLNQLINARGRTRRRARSSAPMVMVMMMPAAPDSLREILHIRQLPAGRRILKVRRKLVQFAGQRRIAARCCRLRRRLQIIRNLQRDLLILRRICLLQLLQTAEDLRKRRELV